MGMGGITPNHFLGCATNMIYMATKKYTPEKLVCVSKFNTTNKIKCDKSSTKLKFCHLNKHSRNI